MASSAPGTIPTRFELRTSTNQAPPLVGHNVVTGDAALAEAVRRHGSDDVLESLVALGAEAGTADAREHGLHATDQLSVRFTDLAQIPATMATLREQPPTTLGGLAVEKVTDLSKGSDALPPTDGLRYDLAEGARVIVRPSGTEPKIKAYLEVVVPVEEGEGGVDAARISAAGRLDAIRGDVQAAAGL